VGIKLVDNKVNFGQEDGRKVSIVLDPSPDLDEFDNISSNKSVLVILVVQLHYSRHDLPSTLNAARFINLKGKDYTEYILC
jgi:hypothetical protein